MKPAEALAFKSGDLVQFKTGSPEASNNNRAPFKVVKEPKGSYPDHISIQDKKGVLFGDSEGLWHKSYFEPYRK